MLSWLTGNAIKAVTEECGPDSIIFPSLKGNGIFDALNKQKYYDNIVVTKENGKSESLWERMYPGFPSTHNEECHCGGMTSRAA